VHSTVPSDPSPPARPDAALDAVSAPVVRFGIFEADLRSGELRRSGTRVKVQELPFKALTLLLSRPNEVLSREDFRQALWPDDVFVDFDHGITTAINRLREALDDSASNPRFVETLERRGYRWIAPVQVDPATLHEPRPADVKRAARDTETRAPWRTWMYWLAPPILAVLVLTAILLARHPWLKNSASVSELVAPPTGVGYPRPSANREAEEFYLKGRYYWEKRTPESLGKAVDLFTQAIVHDPSYAPAYVGLADCYNLLREYTVMPAAEAYPRALAAAKKAVELDPQSSEAHASLAFASFYGMWDSATADREFRRAIELNPSNGAAHHWYATYLACLRRYPEALAEIERARSLDPASKSVLADEGSLLFSAGRRDESTALLKQMEENEPDFISPHRYLKFIYLITGDYPHYLLEARKEAELMHDSSALAIADASEKAFAADGEKGLRATLAREQRKLYERGLISPYILATTYSIVGNPLEALRYLRIAHDERADGLVEIESNPAFDTLHAEPAFQKLAAEVGLPPAR